MDDLTDRGGQTDTIDKENSVYKALKILSTLGELSFQANGEARLSELVGRTGYARPTVHRLLTTMKQCGFVSQTASGPYRFGPEFMLVAQQAFGKADIRRMALPSMANLSHQSGYTVHLGVRDGSEVVYIDKREPPQGLHISSAIGQRRPLQFTALGKAILAWAPIETSRECLAKPWQQRTKNSLPSAEAVIAQFSDIRQRGYAIDNEESDLGFRCVAAPLLTHGHVPVAAISLTTLSAQVSDTELEGMGQKIARTAREISNSLGGGSQ
ncbi:IclR family transcriptional regulator [Asticcacaulis sp. AC402]|uniref:IclR family transcriptional regulator n=1 Tax=Asticcacaulis sp. AC402 TaxID=1282361 RepID=UPI0003C3ADB2|nr:IclR family transcriptional regulator [Asticcacaulis sp. AC402]ESQ77124.1 hypothetical protein ABAC402_01630 [Asticcacaulis sp. AC402]